MEKTVGEGEEQKLDSIDISKQKNANWVDLPEL